MACQPHAEVLSSVPQAGKGCALPYGEDTRWINKLHSGISYSTIGCEFNIRELNIYIKQGVFKGKNTWNKIMY